MISFRAALALIVGVPVVVLGAAVVLQVMRDVPIRHLLSDPVEWADVPLYAGAIGYFGVLLWAATAAVLLFVAAMVGPGWTPVRTFLLRAGLITAWLCLDDLYAGHEALLPILGFNKIMTFGTYGGVVLLHLVLSRGVIRSSRWWLLAISLGLFAISLAVDVGVTPKPDRSPIRLAEDGPKLAGIVAWLLYHVDFAASALRSSIDAARPPDSGSRVLRPQG